MSTDFAVRHVQYRYQTGFALGPISLEVRHGEMVGLLGPNGSGKSTLLKLIAGVLRPNSGAIMLEGLAASRFSRRDLAQRIAVVPQEVQTPFAFTAREIVALGRTAYAGMWGTTTRRDRAAIDRALELTDTGRLQQRLFGTLSGGERQRVLLAMALAQESRLLLLDEPTAHLDVRYQVEILDLLTRLHAAGTLTVCATLHDLNLASLYFPRLVLLALGKVVADGDAAAVLRADVLAPVFGGRVRLLRHPERGVPLAIPEPETWRV